MFAKHLELFTKNQHTIVHYIHHKVSMIVLLYANLKVLFPLDRLMNGQTIKLMRTNLMGSQQITFLYDLIYSYFPYNFKKRQVGNEEGIIQFIVSIYIRFVYKIFLETEEKKN